MVYGASIVRVSSGYSFEEDNRVCGLITSVLASMKTCRVAWSHLTERRTQCQVSWSQLQESEVLRGDRTLVFFFAYKYHRRHRGNPHHSEEYPTEHGIHSFPIAVDHVPRCTVVLGGGSGGGDERRTETPEIPCRGCGDNAAATCS